MVARALENRTLTKNLCVVKVGNNTVDVFTEHDYNQWARYGYHKGKWTFQSGSKLPFPLFKEMVDGIAGKD